MVIPTLIDYTGVRHPITHLTGGWLPRQMTAVSGRTRLVHVISSDTLVEQPLVAAWVDASLARVREAAAAQGLPFIPHKLSPAIEDSFWVNLIGRGYPAPRQKFPWCTAPLHTRPSPP